MAIEKRRIPAFYMAGVILKEDAGNALEMFFLGNETVKHLNIGVEIRPMAVDEVQAEPPVINDQAPSMPALPPPQKKKSRGGKKSTKKAPPSGDGLKAFLRQLIIDKAPIHRAEAIKIALHNGHKNDSIRVRLYELYRDKEVKRVDGVYTPSKRMAKKMNGAAAPGLRARSDSKETIAGITLRVIQGAYPNAVPLRDIIPVVKKKGLRPESTSVAINSMKERGLIEAIPVTGEGFTKFHYKFIPPQQPPQQ